MILEVFSVYDKAVKAFLPPFYCRSRGEALRSFQAAVNDEAHQFKKYPADYLLMYLCQFDDASGLFSGGEPQRVISAQEAIVDNDIFPPEKQVS